MEAAGQAFSGYGEGVDQLRRISWAKIEAWSTEWMIEEEKLLAITV
jgi:hypothetical protein